MGYRYIGTKTKILDKILSKIGEICPKGSHITDLMCGTATVSTALRENGYQVTATDLMTFSYHHARVALLLSAPPKFSSATEFIKKHAEVKQKTLFALSAYEKILHALNNVLPRKGYFWREFCNEGKPKLTKKPRNYFSPDNAKHIDAIRKQIKLLHNKKYINDLEHSLLLHDLILAANDVANIAGTYGHYLSKLIGRANSGLELKPTIFTIKNNPLKHKVMKGYAEELASTISCDLCYIDPPYMKRQYAANYHILETLAREDEPPAIGVSGLRPWRDQYSNFCTKTKIRDSFKKIILDMKCKEFLISYSEDGLLQIEELCNFFSKFGSVNLTGFKNKRFKSNETRLSEHVTEYLIHISRKS